MLESFEGMIKAPAIIAGSSKVSTRKERVRTRSRYSRLMMSHVLVSPRLRIGVTHRSYASKLRIGLAYRFDKDLFQRRLHQLKLAKPCVCRRRVQQILRIGTRCETHFHIVSVVVKRLPQLRVGKKLRVALILDLHIPLPVSCADLAQIPFQNRSPMIEQAD